MDVENLKKLAEAAGGSKWHFRDDKVWNRLRMTDEAIFDMNIGRGDDDWKERRAAEMLYAAAANPAAVLELIAHIETLERRYRWAANELLACDYGDNQAEGKQIGWVIYGWRNKDIGSMQHAEKPRIYGESIDAAIDAKLAKLESGVRSGTGIGRVMPAHLCDDATFQCDKCGRKSYAGLADSKCNMMQPNGSSCTGTMQRKVG